MLNVPNSAVLVGSAAVSNHSRVVLIVSPDASLRDRLRNTLTRLRWRVFEAPSGATASLAAAEASQVDALLVDTWLPDLQVQEFLSDCQSEYPKAELMTFDGLSPEGASRSPYRHELLYALTQSREGDTAAWNQAFQEPEETARVSRMLTAETPFPMVKSDHSLLRASSFEEPFFQGSSQAKGAKGADRTVGIFAAAATDRNLPNRRTGTNEDGGFAPSERVFASENRRDSLSHSVLVHNASTPVERIPELIGDSPSMLEVSRRIRLVANRTTPVLVEGPTGSGKEVVAEALHRLSNRARKPFVAINCAAIPEALLEAELFGHTRGAFTGAVQGRIGRIESADGGTLFLDEIGEMPLALQSKLLRFFENGEIQRIGNNETIRVDVRLIAATHQPLAENAQKGVFRADLYYRLAVFIIHTPALSDHMTDLGLLVAHFMERMGRNAPVKRVDPSAMQRLASHDWPGNVRELDHVLERASILAGDNPVITDLEIDFGLSLMN